VQSVSIRYLGQYLSVSPADQRLPVTSLPSPSVFPFSINPSVCKLRGSRSSEIVATAKAELFMKRLTAFTGLTTVVLIGVLTPREALPSLTVGTPVKCSGGEYMVGLTGRTGLWIDAVGPICARWDGRNFAKNGRSLRPVGGGGGGKNRRTCPFGSAISGWQIESVRSSSMAYVDRITIQCTKLGSSSNAAPATFVFGGQNNLPRVPTWHGKQGCPKDRLATGVSVWTSSDKRFVTNAQLICS